MSVLWGIDLGGTKIEGIVIDSQDFQKVHFRERLATGADLGYQHILNQVGLLVEKMTVVSSVIPSHLGIGTPGTLNPVTQTIKGANTTCLNGQMLKADLETKLNLEIRMANDANCFALAETKIGVGSIMKDLPEVVFGIIMGTGTGSGIVINGRVLQGHHGVGGEWGHNFLDADGGKCYCGRIGCVETMISGPALEAYYFRRSGVEKSLKQISEDAKTDVHAHETIDRLIRNFGKAVGAVVNIIDPDLIILGGGVGNVPQLKKYAHQAIAPYVFQSDFDAKIVSPVLGDSAGVFGAALL